MGPIPGRGNGHSAQGMAYAGDGRRRKNGWPGRVSLEQETGEESYFPL